MIHTIKIDNFRNYHKLNLSFKSGVNIIIGNNGTGKTNILEAIYKSLLTKSFKKVSDEYLLNHTSEYFRLEITKEKDNYVYYYDKISKKVFINGKIMSRLSKFIKNNKVIFFGPDDMYLIKGTPKEKRSYLNLELSQYDELYLNELIEYNNILKNKKKHLKSEIIDLSLIETYNSLIIPYNNSIIKKRKQYIDLLNQNINKLWSCFYPDIKVNIEYESKNTDLNNISFESTVNLYKNLLEKEAKYRTTLIGPHLDDLIIKINNKEAVKLASEGQIKILILVIKLTEAKLFNEKFKTNPIILLDDLFSELDINNSNKVLNLIDSGTQVIITTPDLNGINKSVIETSQIIKLEGEKDGQ